MFIVGLLIAIIVLLVNRSKALPASEADKVVQDTPAGTDKVTQESSDTPSGENPAGVPNSGTEMETATAPPANSSEIAMTPIPTEVV